MSLSSTTFEESLQEILGRLVPDVALSERCSLCEALLNRESLRPTVLPNGVAFPRAETASVDKIICGVGLSEIGIRLGHETETPIQALFVSLYPEGQFKMFMPVLENLVRFSQNPRKMASLRTFSQQKEELWAVRNEIFPRGVKGLIRSHVLSPVNHLRNRMGEMVKVRDD
jgi:mannitol/fructose-specific phosphotransferase system IIA component (Ntr-type)